MPTHSEPVVIDVRSRDTPQVVLDIARDGKTVFTVLDDGTAPLLNPGSPALVTSSRKTPLQTLGSTSGDFTYVPQADIRAANGGKTFLADSTQPVGYVLGHPMDRAERALKPTGAIAETMSRRGVTMQNTVVANTSGQAVAYGLALRAHETVLGIAFFSGGTAIVNPTNQWFALFDNASTPNVLAKTVDDTSTAWAANAVKVLLFAAPFVTTYEGLHYIAQVVATSAGNVQTMTGVADTGSTINAVAPILAGGSTTGLTNPASLGATATALTATSKKQWGWAV